MSFAAFAGPVAGALVGGMMGNRAAKHGAAANRYATDQQMRPYNLKEPFYQRLFGNAEGALNDALATGAFGGSTYAGMDPMAREGFNYMADFGRGAMGDASGFMDRSRGFGTNFQNIFNRASGPTLDNAVNFATSSPQAQSLIDAAMRDSQRRFDEQTMPGINMAASGTGNTNSSRAGVAEALAQRALDDRRADVSSDVYRNLTNQFLRSNTQDINNMMRANEGLKNTYGIGFGMGSNIGNMLTRGGSAFQTDAQGRLDAERDLFDRQRDFAMNQFRGFNSLLGGLPAVGQIAPNRANPYTAALSGAMMGFGAGGNIADLFKQQPPTPTMTPAVVPRGGDFGFYNDMTTF